MIEFFVPTKLVDLLIQQQGLPRPRYGSQPYEDLSRWLVFRKDVTEWMEVEMRRKSGIRLRLLSIGPYRGAANHDRDFLALEPMSNVPLVKLGLAHQYKAYFQNDSDGMLFKLKWF